MLLGACLFLRLSLQLLFAILLGSILAQLFSFLQIRLASHGVCVLFLLCHAHSTSFSAGI